MSGADLIPESDRALYLRGIDLFNQHQFFEAHEVWEDLWRTAQGDRRRFYQGMIQCAVALEHYRRSNPRGVVSLFRNYPAKFVGLPDPFMGLEIAPFLAAMAKTLEPVVTANPLAQRGEIELDARLAPTISLKA